MNTNLPYKCTLNSFPDLIIFESHLKKFYLNQKPSVKTI